MIKNFWKKINNVELIDKYHKYFDTKKAREISGDKEDSKTVFLAPPLSCDVFPFSYLKSHTLVDIKTKKLLQKWDNVSVHSVINMDPIYADKKITTNEDRRKSLKKQANAGKLLLKKIGCWSINHFSDVEFVDYLAKNLLLFNRKWYLNHSLDVRYWSIDSQTVVSDSQILSEKIAWKYYFIKFFIDSKKHTVTAWLENSAMLFWAAAIVVSPFDKRYKKFVWKNVIVPIVNRKIPIITDERVDMSKDTGAIVLIPTHNREHFIIARDNNISCDYFAIDKNWFFTNLAWEFSWKYSFDFVDNIVQYLGDISNLEWVRDQTVTRYIDKYNINHKLIPLATQQWFFSNVNQHLTDGFTAKENFVSSQNLVQEFFQEDAICVSKHIHGEFRFPFILKKDGTLVSLNTELLLEEYHKNGEWMWLVFTNMAIFAILQWKINLEFTMEDLILAITEEEELEWESSQTYLFNTYSDYLKKVYSSDTLLLKELDVCTTMLQSSVLAPEEFDSIINVFENNYGIIENADQKFTIDWKCFGLEDGEELVWHTIDSTFLASMYNLYQLETLRPDTVNMFMPYTMKPWSKFILSVDNINATYNNLYEIKSLEWLFLQIDWLNKILLKRWPDVLRWCIISDNLIQDWCLEEWQAEIYQRFITKFWNATRFVTWLNEKKWVSGRLDISQLQKTITDDIESLNDFDVWMLLKMNHLVDESSYYFDRDQYVEWLNMLIQSVWYDFCDCFLEVGKDTMSSQTLNVLNYCIWMILHLLYSYFPFVSYNLRNIIGYEGEIDQKLAVNHIEWVTKNYKFNMLMDMVASWNHLHAQHRAQNLYDDVLLSVQANRDFVEFTKWYEDFIFKMLGAKKIEYYNEQSPIDSTWSVDRVVDILVWIKYEKKSLIKTWLKELTQELNNKEQMLENVRSIVLILDRSSDEYQKYIGQIDELKDGIENLEYEINKVRYGI